MIDRSTTPSTIKNIAFDKSRITKTIRTANIISSSSEKIQNNPLVFIVCGFIYSCHNRQPFSWYFSCRAFFFSLSNVFMYFFQPGQNPICHRQSLPINDFGALSYFALIEHFSQLCCTIRLFFTPSFVRVLSRSMLIVKQINSSHTFFGKLVFG